MGISSRAVVVGGLAMVIAASAGWYLATRGGAVGPAPDSEAYQQLVRVFYRGVAALDTGLLDTAQADFRRSTEIAPAEPAGWANLGLVHLRRGEPAAAAGAIERAASLAPDNGEINMLRAVLEISRGNLDAAVAWLRGAVALDPRGVRSRFALAEALERAADRSGTSADAESERILDEVLILQPQNLAVLLERTRLAGRRGDSARLAALIGRIAAASDRWPAAAQEQLAALRTVVANDPQAAGRELAFLRNVLAPVPAYRDSLLAVRVPPELMAEAFERFIALPSPSSTPSPPDLSLTYTPEPLDAGAASTVLAWPMDAEGTPGLFVAAPGVVRRVGAQPATWPFVGVTSQVALDWNHDFSTDLLLVGRQGVRLLLQEPSGAFTAAPPPSLGDGVAALATAGAWTADLDMDGDLDLVIGAAVGEPHVIRNNGDGSSRELRLFGGVDSARDFAWGDLDRDGDPDAALLSVDGVVRIFTNQQAGMFDRRASSPRTDGAVALALGDANADGAIDLLTLGRNGAIDAWSSTADFASSETLATWADFPASAVPGAYQLRLADLDNNGALDVIASGGGTSRFWLADERGTFQPLSAAADTEVSGVLDLNADGWLDLVGVSAGQPVRMLAHGVRPYHWQVIRARATVALGDQRINSFGVGGEIEIRSGLLLQKQLLNGAPIHIGLGTRTAVDVARIVWPNGVVQAEFDLRGDQPVVAAQRLKGSCPWVFAYDGREIGFVTDFLWRSPLGLRINAQDTAGVTQTEDWVKIRGDQLAARDGLYDVRITAELWETHFFDHVSLMVVDHSVGSEVFVDERFARDPPRMAVHAMATPRPVASAHDDRGRDVTADIQARDGRHVAGFERGVYQGLTKDHALEIDLGAAVPDRGPLWLVAQGWVYPTDSSINVAIGQGSLTPPRGIALDAQEPGGGWRVLNPDLGFPAGKNKTILIDLSSRPAGARRFRLRTNMEVYWDSLAWAIPAPEAQVRQARLPASGAELRYRGFSRTAEDRAAHAPELPRYAEIANTAPRWRDLVGFHTRFGDVVELVARVDDRYVIMNAGDEMRLSFVEPPPPPNGWVRDFVLVGDGWEKDGDYNTGYSKTVQPLPLHGRSAYTAPSGSQALRDDPSYQRHPEDWEAYHTRFVSPDRYLRGLFGSKSAPAPQSAPR